MQTIPLNSEGIEQRKQLPLHDEILVPGRPSARSEEPTALVRRPSRQELRDVYAESGRKGETPIPKFALRGLHLARHTLRFIRTNLRPKSKSSTWRPHSSPARIPVSAASQ